MRVSVIHSQLLDGERSFSYTLCMSERQYHKSIESELRLLNVVIDKKIVSGLDYRAEARRHKELLKKKSLMRRGINFATFASFLF